MSLLGSQPSAGLVGKRDEVAVVEGVGDVVRRLEDLGLVLRVEDLLQRRLVRRQRRGLRELVAVVAIHVQDLLGGEHLPQVLGGLVAEAAQELIGLAVRVRPGV